MAKRDHRFTILGKKYLIGVDDRFEEVYRMGERELNQRLLAVTAAKIDGYNDRDYLALVAHQLATELVSLQHDHAVEPETDSLAAIIEKIEQRLK